MVQLKVVRFMDSDGVFNRAGEPRLGEGIGGERIVNDIIWR